MIFLTGGTGFLGHEVLAELIKSRPVAEEYCLLIRAKGQKTPQDRFELILKNLEDYHCLPAASISNRMHFVCGDLTQDKFGLSDFEYLHLTRSISEIFHLGASVSFVQSLKRARRINVLGTKNILALARAICERPGWTRGSAALLNYVSTAYVAGDKERIVLASELETEHDFKNSYEQSKAEAEQLVRNEWNTVPTHIYRPSIIVGHSKTGYSSNFSTMYTALKIFMRGLYKTFPGNPSVPIDLVPVDYVARSIASISKFLPKENPCYHLCVGANRETSFKEILATLSKSIDNNGYKKFNFPKLIRPEARTLCATTLNLAVTGMERLENVFESFAERNPAIVQRMLPYILYLNRNPKFDMIETLDKFPDEIENAPKFIEYYDSIFAFWLKHDSELDGLVAIRSSS